MIKGIGIDLVDIARFKDKLYDAFIDRILSQEERHVFDGFKEEQRQMTYLASRFAAKEAYTKAVKHFDSPLNFKDVSVLNDAHGAPYLVSAYQPHRPVWVSLSHTHTQVVAMVVLGDA